MREPGPKRQATFEPSTSPILSSLLTLACYVIGHLLWSFDLLQSHLTSTVGRTLCATVYYLLPNLGNFDIKGRIVHGLPVEPGEIGFAILYAMVYSAAVLLAACAVFQRKELP